MALTDEQKEEVKECRKVLARSRKLVDDCLAEQGVTREQLHLIVNAKSQDSSASNLN